MDRTKARVAAMKLAYEWEMGGDGGDDTLLGLLEIQPGEPETDYMNLLVDGVKANAAALDEQIAQYAANWRLERIERVTLSILRVAVFELNQNQIPDSIVINEALEMTKAYSAPESVAFVNGILGSVQRAKAAKA